METPRHAVQPEGAGALQGRMPTVAVCIPVRNGGEVLREALKAVHRQRLPVARCILMDTESSDGVPEYARALGWDVVAVSQGDFDHGGTRQAALERCGDCDLVVFLTQDAVLLDEDGLGRIVAPFEDGRVAAAYGRQVPRADATFFEAFPRCFNYTSVGYRSSAADIPRRGIRAAFISDSFAAWRISAVQRVGGFGRRVPGGEDLHLAARLLSAGNDIVYAADAAVIHSHHFGFGGEFRRYFDIGMVHALERDVIAPLGRPTGEGWRYAHAELRGAWQACGLRGVLISALRSAMKWVAYSLGYRHRRLPVSLRARFSTTHKIW